MSLSRRAALSGGFGFAGAGALGACTRDRAAHTTSAASDATFTATPATWHASTHRRQSGVTGTPGTYGWWLGIDLKPGSTKDDLRRFLIVMSDAARRLVAGNLPVTDMADELAATPGEITVTIGFGPQLFSLTGMPQAPSWLKPIPQLPIDRFEKPWDQTDLVVQVGGDDPIVTSHAVGQLATYAVSFGTIRWRQSGVRPAPRPHDRGVVRNHFGQLDGQVNPSGEGKESQIVWNSASQGKQWLADTTGMVIRRIRMDVETWDSLDREARENAVGRRLSNGAPLTSGSPTAPFDATKTDASGLTIINPAAHVTRSLPEPGHPEQRILRRPYNYERETDAGTPDRGLIFVAFCADVERQFVPIQRRLAEGDLLNTWTTPIGSAVFFIPQAPRPGEYLGQTVLEAGR